MGNWNESGYKCQKCGRRHKELEAAHVRGDRKTLIEGVLKRYVSGNSNRIEINLEKVEGEIMAAHKPIRKTFRFVCSGCHRKHFFTR